MAVELQPFRCTVCGRIWQRTVKVIQGGTVRAQVVKAGHCNRCWGRVVAQDDPTSATSERHVELDGRVLAHAACSASGGVDDE